MLKDSNKLIAKNTILLYLRMIIIMLVSLYTARIVLIYLGISDFGIYNIVGGVVIMFGFLQSALTSGSMRFITIEIGRNDNVKLKKVFSLIMTSHLIIALIVFVLAETVGLWFVNTHLNIAEERMTAVNWVYQFSIFSFIFNIIKVPYNATVVAYEKMSFFALASIIETSLKLLLVFLLPLISFDKLSVYGGLMFVAILFSTYIYKLYCNKNFKISKYKFIWDKKLFWQLSSFSGWSMMGATANIGAHQGGNIILNLFSGVVANASFGIANQVSAAVSTFSSNLITAFNPQIIKNYSIGEKDNMFKLIMRASSYSSFLVILVAIPFLLNTDLILNIWLQNVPEYAVVFCQLMIIYQIIDVIQAPLGTLINATGKIKIYQIWLSSLLLLNVPISFFLLKIGWEPYWVLIIRIGINLISSIVRTIYVWYLIKFPSWIYSITVIFNVFKISALSFGLSFLIKQFNNAGISGLIYTSLSSIIITILVIYFVGINKNERAFINVFLVNFVKKNKKLK